MKNVYCHECVRMKHDIKKKKKTKNKKMLLIMHSQF